MSTACAVCAGRLHGIHFGVSSCRACAAFFRRTIAQGANYTCREGRKKCPVIGVVKACRACRFAKCQQEGMKSEAVQLLRDRYGSRKKQKEEAHKSSCSQSSLCIGPSSSQLKSNLNPLVKIVQNTFEQMERTYQTEILPILDQLEQMCTAYYKLRQELSQVYSDELASTRLRPVRHNYLMVMQKILGDQDMREMLGREALCFSNFLKASDAFARLPMEQKWAVYKRFWPRMLLLDHIYINYEDDYREYLELLEGKRWECQHVDPSIHHDRRKHQLVIEPLAKISPSIKEFMYIVTNVLWNLEGRDSITEETLVVAAQEKHNACNELHRYYAQNGIRNYAYRLAVLSSVAHAVDGFVARLREDTRALLKIQTLDGDHQNIQVLELLDMSKANAPFE